MGNGLCRQRKHEKLFPGEPLVENSQGDGRNLFCREMRPHEIVHHPVEIKRPLESLFILGIGVGRPAKSGVAAAKGAVESFAVVGMNVSRVDILHSCRMLGTRGLILGALAALSVRLGAFVLQPDLCPFLERLAGTSPLAGPDKLMADLQ